VNTHDATSAMATGTTLTLTEGARSRFSPAQTATAMLIVAAVCGHILLALPRTAIPTAPPALHIDDATTQAMRAMDRARAAKAPTSPVARALDHLLLEKGESEREPTELQENQMHRSKRIAFTLEAFKKREGEEALLSMRALAVERMQKALDLQVPKEEQQAVLGNFPTILKEALVTRDGLIVAPMLVVRTLAKVRWNVTMGLPQFYGLETAERRAYSGWFGLHGENGPLPVRLDMLKIYADNGGHYVNEARAILGYRGGDPTGALAAFELAHQVRPSYRTRNFARSAKRAENTMIQQRIPGRPNLPGRPY